MFPAVGVGTNSLVIGRWLSIFLRARRCVLIHRRCGHISGRIRFDRILAALIVLAGSIGFDLGNDVPYLHFGTWLGQHFRHLPGKGRRNLHQGLVGFKFDDRVVHRDRVPDIDVHRHHYPRFDVLANFRNRDRLCHFISFS